MTKAYNFVSPCLKKYLISAVLFDYSLALFFLPWAPPHSTQLELFLIHLLIIVHNNRVVFHSVLVLYKTEKQEQSCIFLTNSVDCQASKRFYIWMMSVCIQQLRWRIYPKKTCNTSNLYKLFFTNTLPRSIIFVSGNFLEWYKLNSLQSVFVEELQLTYNYLALICIQVFLCLCRIVKYAGNVHLFLLTFYSSCVSILKQERNNTHGSVQMEKILLMCNFGDYVFYI